jgi:hypothetical protein
MGPRFDGHIAGRRLPNAPDHTWCGSERSKRSVLGIMWRDSTALARAVRRRDSSRDRNWPGYRVSGPGTDPARPV